MSPEAQFIALLDWMGWVLEPAGKDSFGVYYAAFWRHPDKQGIHVLPPLTLDLMHEAEEKYLKSCTVCDQQSLWLDWLGVTVGWKKSTKPSEAKFECALNSAHATAFQRLEALLKTLNLWTDSVC